MSPRPKLTARQRAAMVDAYCTGESPAQELAQAYGVSDRTLYRAVLALGRTGPNPKPPPLTDAEVAEIVRLYLAHVESVLGLARRFKRTPATIRRLLDAAGAPHLKIHGVGRRLGARRWVSDLPARKRA